jgi:hypothetical protein
MNSFYIRDCRKTVYLVILVPGIKWHCDWALLLPSETVNYTSPTSLPK